MPTQFGIGHEQSIAPTSRAAKTNDGDAWIDINPRLVTHGMLRAVDPNTVAYVIRHTSWYAMVGTSRSPNASKRHLSMGDARPQA